MNIKKFLYTHLSCDNYLRVLQRCYFLLYHLGLLRFNPEYTCHYYVKKLINKGDTVIDIGANLGYYSLLFAKWVGKGGKVYAVEPVSIYNKIFNEQAKKYPNIILLPYALGREEKAVELVSVISSGYLRTGLSHVYTPEKDDNQTNIGFKVQAQMKIASQLFKDMEKINYIKMDIEGGEYAVLLDMKDLIQYHKPIIQVEMNDPAITDLLYRLGYRAAPSLRKKLGNSKDKIFMYI
ncbi:MAG: FkbM family methyltransferase [Bacteroidetes bacterium]|nr:FkbM family methyltransferase [Bacteroidota bacterium]